MRGPQGQGDRRRFQEEKIERGADMQFTRMISGHNHRVSTVTDGLVTLS
jgi:hypothetical protein